MYLVIQRTELEASHIRGLRLSPLSLTPHIDFKSIELPSHSRGQSTGVPWIRIPGTVSGSNFLFIQDLAVTFVSEAARSWLPGYVCVCF